jgi:alkylation response protein AidB-like acyl-CoA dehydrogenase
LADQENQKPPADLIYEDTGSAAPVVYFDIVGAYGTMNGAIEVEVATRILVPKPDGSTEVKFLSSGRLRCSAQAASNLRNALDAALKMLEQPQAEPVAASRMN